MISWAGITGFMLMGQLLMISERYQEMIRNFIVPELESVGFDN